VAVIIFGVASILLMFFPGRRSLLSRRLIWTLELLF